jgi:hypothetical protein
MTQPPVKSSSGDTHATLPRNFLLDKPDAFSFFKEQYEELCSSERHIGTIRTRIAWSPATIIVGIIALFLKNQSSSGNINIGLLVIGLIMMFLILLLIFVSDVILLGQQKTAAQMCKACEAFWLQSATVEKTEIKTFSQLKSYVAPSVAIQRKIFGDIANTMLFIYYIFLYMSALSLAGVSYWLNGESISNLTTLLDLHLLERQL